MLVSNMSRSWSIGKSSIGPFPEMAALLTMTSSSPARARALAIEILVGHVEGQPHGDIEVDRAGRRSGPWR